MSTPHAAWEENAAPPSMAEQRAPYLADCILGPLFSSLAGVCGSWRPSTTPYVMIVQRLLSSGTSSGWWFTLICLRFVWLCRHPANRVGVRRFARIRLTFSRRSGMCTRETPTAAPFMPRKQVRDKLQASLGWPHRQSRCCPHHPQRDRVLLREPQPEGVSPAGLQPVDRAHGEQKQSVR